MTDLLAVVQSLSGITDDDNGTHRLVSSRRTLEAELFEYVEHPLGADTCLVVHWESGGAQGGDWDGGQAEPYSTVFSGELLLLDALLAKVAPDLPFAKLTEMRALIEHGLYSSDAHYGNYIDHTYKFIPLSVVAERLAAWGYL